MKIIITSKGDKESRIEPLYAELTMNQIHAPEEYPEIRAILGKAFWDICGEPVKVVIEKEVKCNVQN